MNDPFLNSTRAAGSAERVAVVSRVDGAKNDGVMWFVTCRLVVAHYHATKETAVNTSPLTVELMFARAREAHSTDNLNKALHLYGAVLAEFPETRQASLARVQIGQLTNDLTVATVAPQKPDDSPVASQDAEVVPSWFSTMLRWPSDEPDYKK